MTFHTCISFNTGAFDIVTFKTTNNTQSLSNENDKLLFKIFSLKLKNNCNDLNVITRDIATFSLI